MALQALRSPFTVSSEVWSGPEQMAYNTAFTKAEIIQRSIDQVFSGMVNAPQFEQKFPAIAAKVNEFIQPHQNGPLPLSLQWIQDEVVNLLKREEKIEITCELAKTIGKASDQIVAYLEEYNEKNAENSDYPIESFLSFVNEFFTNYKLFLEKYKSECSKPEIFEILNGTPPSGSITDEIFAEFYSSIDSSIKDLNGALFSNFCIYASSYEEFITPALKIVQIAAQTLTEPHQYTGTRGDNPLGVGMALRHNIQQKQAHAALEAFTETDEFKTESLKVIEKTATYTRRYHAADEKERFSIALQILNTPCGEDSEDSNDSLRIDHFPLTLRLNLLCVLSRQSKDLPVYFKTLAMDLCRQVEKFEKKAPELPGEKPDCCIS
ncbi:MAG: hypothetical protein WCF65_08245 [Parachlamydiaceae bacterium]